MRGRSSRSSARSTTQANGKRKIAIFAEGAKTEPRYINHWSRVNRDNVQIFMVKTVWGFAPKTLVDHAIKEKARGPWSSGSDPSGGDIEYWCVFDVDEHHELENAIQKAISNGINVAVSNPCIELWFVLHFQDQNAHIDRKTVQSLSKKHLNCGKILSASALERLQANFADTKKRAQYLDRMHKGNGSPPRSNPSSNVWELIDSISR